MQRVLKSRLPGGVVAQWVRATVHWATLPRIPGFDYGYDLPGTAYFEGFLIPHIKGTVSQAGLRSRSRSRQGAAFLPGAGAATRRVSSDSGSGLSSW